MVITPPPENFNKFVLQSKTKSFELQQFQGQQHFNVVTAHLLLMHPGWQVGFLLHFGFFSLRGSSLLYSLHSSAHQAGEHGHDHLWLHLHKILWKSINSGTNSSCHGHSIPIHHGKIGGQQQDCYSKWQVKSCPSNTISPIFIKIQDMGQFIHTTSSCFTGFSHFLLFSFSTVKYF